MALSNVFYDNWVSAHVMHTANPSVIIPSDIELSAIKPGTTVKISNGVEPIMVNVTSISHNCILGSVSNHQLFNSSVPYKFGDTVSFKYENVYVVYDEEYTRTKTRKLMNTLAANLRIIDAINLTGKMRPSYSHSPPKDG